MEIRKEGKKKPRRRLNGKVGQGLKQPRENGERRRVVPVILNR